MIIATGAPYVLFPKHQPRHPTRDQALAKALAYRDRVKPEQAAAWAAKLVRMLEAEHILHPRFRNRAEAGASRELPSC